MYPTAYLTVRAASMRPFGTPVANAFPGQVSLTRMESTAARRPSHWPAVRVNLLRSVGYHGSWDSRENMPSFAQSTTTKTRKNFQRLTELRAKEATTLARSRNQQGAYYLAGFAVECALKACIAKKTKRHDFPADAKHAGRVYSHDLTELLKLAGLDSQLDRDMRGNPQLAANWGVVKAWRVDCRYETSGLSGKDMVDSLDSPDGVLTWIKLRW